MISLIKFWSWIALIFYGFGALYNFSNKYKEGQFAGIDASGQIKIETPITGFLYCLFRAMIAGSIIYFL